MTNREIENCLNRIASLLELHGANPFKSRAYSRAARAIRGSAVDVAGVIADGTPLEIDGIGKGIAAEVAEVVESGTTAELEDLMERTPRGLLDVLSIRGLGSKKVRALWQELGIESIDDLERTARSGEIADLKGFGAKTATNILAGIATLRENAGKIRLHTATDLGDRIAAVLESLPMVARFERSGRLRRRCETLSSIDFVLSLDSENADTFLSALSECDEISDVDLFERRISCRFASVPLHLHLATPENFGLRLLLTTGSSDFRLMYSVHVEKSGGRIDHDQLYLPDGPIAGTDEDELFAALDIATIPPELREGIDESTLASNGQLPHLIEPSDIQGVLHVHSTWSDGRHTIAEMAKGAHDRGYGYLLICDHSKAAFYANGLDEARLAEQGAEIDELNKQYDPAIFRILKGTECDILADGTLDLADAALAALDAVVISVHSSFTLPREDQTNRICRALAHPSATILAHPTGRLLLTRKEYDVDLKRVIEAAGEHGKIIELNANPYRLDLDWRMLRFAKKKGVPIAINPDAHAVEQIDFIRYGIDMARKGGLEAADVINTLNADEFLARRG